MNGKSGISMLLAVVSCAAVAETVTLAPAAGETTNVLQFFTGDTAVEIAGPGTVALLNPANSHTGGTTLSGGTLELSDNIAAGDHSPVGAGLLTVSGGTLRGSSTFAREIAGTGAASIEAPDGWTWTGSNAFSAAATVADGTLEIADGETAFNGGLTVADGASISVTGGTLGINTASGAGTGAINVNGGTIKNVSTAKGGSNNWFDWLNSTVSVSIGAEGAVFKGGGTTAFYAQIRTPLTSSAAPGGTAAGVTFDGGNWGYYASMTHDGPTVIKNGASVFISGSGYIPSASAVIVGSGSQLRLGKQDRTIASLVLEEGAILGFANETKVLTVSGAVTLPASAKIALYANNDPKTAAKSTDGKYDVLTVPIAYADALRAVRWSCATTADNKSYKFSVSTSGGTATLSVEIGARDGTLATSQGADTSLTVSEDEYIYRNGGLYVGSGSLTMNGGFLEMPSGNILSYGTGGGGTVTLNGGLLDVKNVRLSSGPGARVDLYLNEGAILRAREMNIDESNAVDHVFHLNGGTLRPVASGSDFKYFPQFQTAYVGEKGVTVDLCDAERDGVTKWYRFSCQTQFDHDPACTGRDGGVTVRGTPGSKALFNFGNTFIDSTMNGEVVVERGGNVIYGTGLSNLNVTLLPGSLFKSYNSTSPALSQSLTIGATGASEAVSVNVTKARRNPTFQTETFSLLSPVEISMLAGDKWDGDASMIPGTYTAVVYRTVSPALDTSLFRLPAEYADDYSISVATVALTEGSYAGYTALVFTVGEAVYDDLEIRNGGSVTLSSDVRYGKIYVGDFYVAGNPMLTVSSGNIRATTLHLAYQPADGASSSTGRHTASYVQNGGSLTLNAIRSMYRGSDVQEGRAYATITMNDGTLTVLHDAYFGLNRTRGGYYTLFTVNGGAVTICGSLSLTQFDTSAGSVGVAAPQGIVVMNGGTLDVGEDIDISKRNNGNDYAVDGGIFLRGGVLSARNIVQSVSETPVQRLVFDGGTYAPNAAAAGQTLSGLTTAHVSTNGAIVSTEKLPAGATYTIAQNLLTDPGLNGAADGGFTKRGASTLALTGANTFTGPTVVEAGTLAVSGADAISDDVTVADGAVLDLGGSSVTLGSVAASGVIGNGALSVTNSLTMTEGSFLNVDGDLTLVPGLVVDFAGSGAGWRPLAAASGTVSTPPMLKARNAGEFKRCKTSVIDGVVYVCPTSVGFMFTVK